LHEHAADEETVDRTTDDPNERSVIDVSENAQGLRNVHVPHPTATFDPCAVDVKQLEIEHFHQLDFLTIIGQTATDLVFVDIVRDPLRNARSSSVPTSSRRREGGSKRLTKTIVPKRVTSGASGAYISATAARKSRLA
jgi:hypothetical protein